MFLFSQRNKKMPAQNSDVDLNRHRFLIALKNEFAFLSILCIFQNDFTIIFTLPCVYF